MAISFVGSAANSAPNGQAVTTTLPGSMAVDDLILAYFGEGDIVDRTPAMTTAGYTGVAELYSNGGSWDVNANVFYKYHNGSDTTAVSAALGDAGTSNCLILMVFRGVALAVDGGPFDVTTTTATGIIVLDPDPPSINWVTAGTWVVIAGGASSGADGAGTYTFPSGYTTDAVQRGQVDTEDHTCGMGYNSAPADPEDPGAMSHSGSTTAGTSWVAYTMALKPAPAGAAVTRIAVVTAGV